MKAQHELKEIHAIWQDQSSHESNISKEIVALRTKKKKCLSRRLLIKSKNVSQAFCHEVQCLIDGYLDSESRISWMERNIVFIKEGFCWDAAIRKLDSVVFVVRHSVCALLCSFQGSSYWNFPLLKMLWPQKTFVNPYNSVFRLGDCDRARSLKWL